MTNNFNIRSGTIIYDDLTKINPNLSFNSQSYDYKEDLLQIGFGYHYCVDVGWLPESDPTGAFIIRVIKNFDWVNPVFKKRTRKLDLVFKYINQAIKIADCLSTASALPNSQSIYLINKLNLRDGIVLFNNFFIDQKMIFERQHEHYQRDMLQIDFGSSYSVNLGWIPEHDPKGYFEIHIIKNNNWEKPKFKKRTRCFDRMIMYLNQAIQVASNLKKLDISENY